MKKGQKTAVACLGAVGIFFFLLLAAVQAGSPWTKTFRCKENTVTISQDAARAYHFQSSGRIQVDRLMGGSMMLTKGVPVYQFKDGDKQYWLWDGTENRPRFGSLEIYEKDELLF